MAEIRTLIVDDEPLARRGIRQLLAGYPDFNVVGECGDGRQAVRALAALRPDLLFLDVQMPGVDGFGVIRLHGAERMPITVFVTAHDEFAVRAFEAAALDYLVKPLSERRFQSTVERVREKIRLNDAVAMAGRLSGLLQRHPDRPVGQPPAASESPRGRTITVPTESGERVLHPSEIDWIRAVGDFVQLRAGDRLFRARDTLTSFEAQLDPRAFARIHRSVIVRLDRVREWKSGVPDSEAALVLRDGTELPVSRRRLTAIRALLRGLGG